MLNLDHIVIVVPELKNAMGFFENQLGVTSVFGGRHLTIGTHNAIFGLGRPEQKQYVELLAIDPERKPNITQFPYGLNEDSISDIDLLTWVARCSKIETAVNRFSGENLFEFQSIQAMSRTKPSGEVINWKLAYTSLEHAQETQGTFPFFIEWGNGPHPVDSLKEENFCEGFSFLVQTPAATQILQRLGNDKTDINQVLIQSNSYELSLSLQHRMKTLNLTSTTIYQNQSKE